MWLLIGTAFLIAIVVLSLQRQWIPLVIIAPAGLFLAWCWLKTGYTITDKELQIVWGPVRYCIPLEKIRKVKNSRLSVSAPALSMDRIEITFDRANSVLISPDQKEEFKKILKERCPQADIY